MARLSDNRCALALPAALCILALGALALGVPRIGWTHAPVPNGISVALVADDGRRFTDYAYHGRHDHRAVRRYVRAERGARYRIQVRNNTARRVAAVITVDGRNVISGARSELAATEPMYVLGAYETQWIDGWRSDLQSVRRFYFTEPGDSYAGAFGDTSAMGVVAVAAYGERYRPPAVITPHPRASSNGKRQDSSAEADTTARRSAGEMSDEAYAPEARSGAARSAIQPPLPSAGTGYGEHQSAPARYAQFEPRAAPFARHFLKYEWPETLAALGVVPTTPPNRFWPDTSGFAPPPPGR